MFRLAKPEEAWEFPVEVPAPAGGGAVERTTYTAMFRLLPKSESDRLAADGDAPLLRAAVTGWNGVADHEGKALPFSTENLGRLLEIPYWVRATAIAYVDFASGQPSKNSATPPAAS